MEQVKTPWSTIGYIVAKRTYCRRFETDNPNSKTEEWDDVVNRVCLAAEFQLKVGFSEDELERFRNYLLTLKGTVAGRFLWQLGTPTVDRLGLLSLQNCAFVVCDEPVRPFTWAMDALMLGSGVGYNIQRENVYKLPKVREDFVPPVRKDSNDADFILPDTREGWVKLLEYTLRAAFDKGSRKGFTYSTQLVRGKGATIKGFGGTASGPEDLVWGITEISKVIEARKGKQLRPIDCLDIFNIIGAIVVAGNVRRSAQIAIGDPDDLQFLRAKNWGSGNIPNWRSNSNNSVVCNDIDTLPEEFWKTYAGNSEPYGLINLKLSRAVGRLGDTRYKDKGVQGYNPCLTYDTPLLTDFGYFPIGELVGEEVAIWNGREWSAVTPFSTGVNEIVRVHLTDGSHIDCTPYHKFLTIEGFDNDKVTRVEAENLKPGAKLQKWDMPRVFGGVDPAIDAYSQGFYSGDGNRDYRYSYVYEPKYQCMGRLIGDMREDSYGRKRWMHGPMLDKSYVPLDATFAYRMNWLAGLLDSDGTVTRDKNGNGFQIASVDQKFLSDVRLMLTTMGVRAKIVDARSAGMRMMPDGRGGHKEYQCQETKRLLIGNSDAHMLLTTGLKLERLQTHTEAPQRDARQYVKVKEVEWLGIEEETFCVTEPLLNQMTVNGIVTGNCAEQSLNNYETCCLAEIFLPNIASYDELVDVAKLLYRVNKHSLRLPCHHPETQAIVHKNMRMGIGVTGYLQATEEQRSWLKDCYEALREFDVEYSAAHGWPVSIKITTCKPSGTLSLLPGTTSGVHPAIAQYMIRRVRISSNHPLVETCREHGYHVEYQRNFDDTEDRSTVVVEFPFAYPEGTVLAKDLTAVDQLEWVKKLQTEWSDNSVSCTVYYRKEELPEIRAYLEKNYDKGFKTLSFLLHSDHGFKQAPFEEITKERYDELIKKTRLIDKIEQELDMDGSDCIGGACPVR